MLRFFPARSPAETATILRGFDERRLRDGVAPEALERKADGRFLGLAGLAGLPAGMPFSAPAQVLWSLLSEAHGFGYATEIGRASLRHGFEALDHPEIVAYCVATNAASEAVIERLGFRRDIEFDHPMVDAATHPHLVRHRLHRLARENWRRASGA